jgi:hypothetical protein
MKVRKAEIPDIFKNSQKEYFKNCSLCHCDLFQDNSFYFVERLFKKHISFNITEVLFEYAICFDCSENLKKELSEESKSNIEKYMLVHFPAAKRLKNLQRKRKLDHFIDQCAITKKAVNRIENYTLIGHFSANKMLLSFAPFVLGEEIIEEMNELISAKTRKVLDNFMDKISDLPPELKQLLLTKSTVLI